MREYCHIGASRFGNIYHKSLEEPKKKVKKCVKN